MADSFNDMENNNFYRAPGALSSTQARLVASARARIVAVGLAEASARSIAREAGANPSAINYNLGGVEQLYSLVFAQAADATALWIREKYHEISALPSGPAGACAALEFVIGAWTSQGRDLALLYQEALSWAGADPALLARWTRQWRDFWTMAARHFGLDAGDGLLLNLFFQSEALYHLSRWSPAIERLALRDLCDDFGWIWLGGARHPASGGLAIVQGLLHGENPDKLAPAALNLALSAVAVVQDRGLLGLTHRAVAAHAGVTVGAVTHYFRTAEDLVAGTIRGQVEQLFMAERADNETASENRSVPSLAHMAEQIDASVATPAVAKVLFARRALFLASLRDPGSARAGAVVRFGYGRTSERILAPFGKADPDAVPLHGAVMSRLVSSLWIAELSGHADERLGAEVIARLERGLGA